MKKFFVVILSFVSLSCGADQIPILSSTGEKIPALYGRKDYLKTLENLNKDQLAYQSITACINKIPTTVVQTNDASVKYLVDQNRFLLDENRYLKLQNEKLLNEIVYNKKRK